MVPNIEDVLAAAVSLAREPRPAVSVLERRLTAEEIEMGEAILQEAERRVSSLSGVRHPAAAVQAITACVSILGWLYGADDLQKEGDSLDAKLRDMNQRDYGSGGRIYNKIESERGTAAADRDASPSRAVS